MTSRDRAGFFREPGPTLSVKAFLRDVEAGRCRFVPSGMVKRRFGEAFLIGRWERSGPNVVFQEVATDVGARIRLFRVNIRARPPLFGAGVG